MATEVLEYSGRDGTSSCLPGSRAFIRSEVPGKLASLQLRVALLGHV